MLFALFLAAPPAPPELPVAPLELAAKVAALRTVAGLTFECYVERGERGGHEADPRCPSWYAKLRRGGAATVYAIGGILAAPTEEEESTWFFDKVAGRLVQHLTGAGAPEALPFMLETLRRRVVDGFDDVDLALLAVLPTYTGHDLTPLGPWESAWDAYEKEETRAAVVSAWTAWAGEHGGKTRAEWLAAGLDRARATLEKGTPLERIAAVTRLLGSRKDRPAVASAVANLLDSELSAEARSHLKKLARRHHLRSSPATAVAIREGAGL
jgi:hypothetical protein